MALGLTASNRNEYQEYFASNRIEYQEHFLGVKAAGA